MKIITVRKHAKAFAAVCLLNAIYSGSALAQTAPVTETTEEVVALENYVVTGSYIPLTETAAYATMAPVVRIDRIAIEQSGFTNTAEFLQKITSSNGGSVPISNNATGFTPAASSISLRGLGPEATLVLINGRRVAPYPVGTGGTTAFVDLNSIPLAAIGSIEVLKDGASALYGADAVAGVVNIKLRRSIDGTEGFVSYGNTTNKDSSETIASLITGSRTPAASLLVGLNYYKKEGINHADREYSKIPPFLSSNSSPLNLEVGRFAANAALGQTPGTTVTGVDNTQNYGTTAAPDIGPRNIFFTQSGAVAANNGLRPPSAYTYSNSRSSTFNFNEFSNSYPQSKRLGTFASGERKLFDTKNITGYIDAAYQQVETQNELAPSATGNFSGSGVELVIPARTTTPILTVIDRTTRAMTQVAAGSAAPTTASPGPGTKFVNGTVQRAAVAGAFNPFNPYNQDITGSSRARFAEFGNRIYRNKTDAFSFTTGIKGERILEKWTTDLSFSYSVIEDNARNTLNSSSRWNRLVNAADPFFDAASADYTGQTTAYNPFGYYQVPIATNQSLVDFDKVDVKDYNKSDLGGVNFTMATGDLMELPAGKLGLAFGGDYRQEKLNQFPDPAGASGDLIGSSPNAITRAQRKIGGVFLEVKVPLLKDLPGAHSLTFDGALRHEEFLTSDRQATVPKLGLLWQPLASDLTFRATYSEGFREPSLYELYSSPTSSLTPITDPRTGVRESEQDVTTAGNRRLEAEETKSYNVGVIYTPSSFLKGLTLSADFWRIEREGTVDSNEQGTVNRFFNLTPSGDPAPGGLQPGESVEQFSDGSIRIVNSLFFNLGRTEVQGVDLEASYVIPTQNMGRFDVSMGWAFLDSYKSAIVAADPLTELVGEDVGFLTDSGVGEDGYLEWKGRVNLDWAFKGFSFHMSGTYTDGFRDFDGAGEPFQVKSTWIFDAQLSYDFKAKLKPYLNNTKITLGARNLFDKDPPFSSGFAGNSTGYPSFLYNSEGQFVYLSLSRKF